MIVFVHTKFGIIQIKGSGDKRGRIPPPSLSEFLKSRHGLVHVKIALNVVKASKLVQMKLITLRSKLGFGAFRKFSAFVLTPI